MTKIKQIVGTVSALALILSPVAFADTGTSRSSDEKSGTATLDEIIVTAEQCRYAVQKAISTWA